MQGVRKIKVKELLKVNYENDRITLSGRELYEFLEVQTKYADWFKRMCEYGFDEDIDYRLVTQKRETNNPKNPFTTINDHEITLEMAKEIAMIQRNQKGKEARQYFIELEKKWNTPEFIMYRALNYSKNEIEKLKLENKKMEHKVIFADAVSSADDSILVGQLAKILRQNGINIGQNRLFEWLRDNDYLIKSGQRYNQPTQHAMELGLFRIKERTINNPNGSIKIIITTKVTGKGQVYFVNKFLSKDKQERIEHDI